jgi:hypothetical protein
VVLEEGLVFSPCESRDGRGIRWFIQNPTSQTEVFSRGRYLRGPTGLWERIQEEVGGGPSVGEPTVSSQDGPHS